MRGLSYDPGILPSEMIIRHRFKPINDIPREEMLARKSFPSVKEVKIYTIVSDQLSPPITGESFCTDMVRHSDYAELEDKYAALAADNDKAMESLKQADAAVKLAHEKFSALAAENAGLKDTLSAVIDRSNEPDYQSIGMGCGVEDNGLQTDGYNACEYGWREAMDRIYSEVIPDTIPETPATDAFLAEVRAHDLNAFIRHHSAELDAHIKNGGEQFDEKSVRIRDIIVSARLFREQIRKEAAQ